MRFRIETTLLTLALCAVAFSYARPKMTRQTSELKWVTGSHQIIVDGRVRTFLLDIPNHLKPGAGLVLISHGFGDSAQGIRDYSGFKDIMDRHNFVIAYPEGTKNAVGKPNFQVEYIFQDKTINDVKFARQIIKQVGRGLQLDPGSVFATGMSNGADFSYYLARQPNHLVSAIAPVAGTMMVDWAETHGVHRPFAVMEIHGTRDSVTLWPGDLTNHDGWGAYLGTLGVMNYWTKTLSLEQTTTKEVRAAHPGKDDSIDLIRWWTAKDRSEVLLYVLHGGEHTWPDHLVNPKRTTAEEILLFFERHRS